MKAVNRAIAVSCALFSFMTAGLSQDIEHKWAVEVHAGGMLPSRPSSGNGVVFPRGEDFTAMNGQPSRRITSWYFGDGSVLLNQVLTAMGRAPEVQITPLDTLLTRSSIQNESSPVFGLRISRTLSRRFEVDVTADYKRKGMAISSEGLAAIEASRSTFITAWNASGLPNLSVSSTSTIRNDESRQLLTTGSLIFNLKTTGRTVPFISGGLGMVTQTSSPPSAELRGAYPFTIGPFSLNESDSVKVRYDVAHHSVIGTLGGGAKYLLSSRWGLRGQGTVYVGGNNVNTVLDTNSTVTPTTSPGFAIVSSTNPSLQFSSNQSQGPSSLSGPRLTRFNTFTSTGTQTEFGVSGGLFFRF